MNSIKKIVGSVALAAVFVTSLGISGFAQDWGRGGRDRQQDDRWGRNDRNNDRYNDRNNDRYDDRYGNGSNSRYAREQMEKGFRDGLDRGRKDAQTNRRRDPNNSSHYRKGNEFYRRGFERGFFQAYNQYSDYGRGRGRWGW
ncbi:MAG: hypothetical protein JNM09_08270 [Blastocatellia bacterium]|nr:hypothetical protein [Blastocatellia bacterium]